MDLKILAAVFATLAIVFVGMNGGGLNLGGIGGILDMFEGEPPEADTKVNAEITVLTNNTTMSVNGDMTVEGLTEYSNGEISINPDEPIQFLGFSGEIFIEENTTITGEAATLNTSSVTMNDVGLNREINTSLIEITGAEGVSFDFERADIQLDQVNSSSSFSETNTSVSIPRFTGNITIRPREKELSLSGNVSTVKAGATEFSGE